MANNEEFTETLRSQYTPLMRFLALLFIALIVQGNVWFVLFLTGQPAPAWMYNIFIGLVFTILAAGSLHGLSLLRKDLNQSSEPYELDTNH